MTEYEIYVTTQRRLETIWRDAQRNARLFAALNTFDQDAEARISREAGGRV